jgi:hypothetical protein
MPPVLRVLLLSLLLAFTATTAPAAAATLTLDPAAGPAGTAVTATGSGFSPRAKGSLSVDGRSVTGIRTDRRGGFRVAFNMPAHPGGTADVRAQVGGTEAQAPFEVLAPAPPPATGDRWIPSPTDTFQIQFTGTLDETVDAHVYDIDGFGHPAETVARLHAAGRRVVCYISAGSWEDWRPDAGDFPEAVLGSSNGWPGERWLDIRRLDVLEPIMRKRIDMCAAKGFDAVEFDNVDAYTNSTGFPLTADDQLGYNRFLAAAAHDRGLSVGLKNDLSQVAQLEPDFDFAINESCHVYSECALLAPFVTAGKAVFGIEYRSDTAICAAARAAGHMTIVKRTSLDAWRLTCF